MNPVSLSPFANHLWQSTLVAGAALLLAAALRQNRAQVRYRLWLAASVKFLVPFSLLLTVGRQVEWRGAQAVAAPLPPALASAIAQFGRPFTASPVTADAPVVSALWQALPALLLLVWLCGFAVVAARWWSRWRVIRTALDGALPLPIPGPVPVMSAATRLEPGIFGVFRPVLLLPEGIAGRLVPAQMQAILAHEFCHVRRRDNLAVALHMIVEAVFWFHPLVWWIGARLIEERERACDEEVLRLGSDPEVYAAGILNVCKFYLESPLPCAAGVTGADLRKRIEAIMARTSFLQLTLARKFLLAAAAIAAVAGPILIGMAQAQRDAPLRFEVATIKPSRSAGGRGGLETLPGGGLRMAGVTIKGLISFAYEIPDERISGGPRWLAADAYDILGKAERPGAADSPQTAVAPGTTAWDRVRERTRTLLAERCGLVIHKDEKEGQAAYALLRIKEGPGLKETAEQGPPGTLRSWGRIVGRRGTMAMLSSVLSNWLGRPVIDRTGLTGTYDYKLEYAQEAGGDLAAPPENPAGSLPDAPGGPSVFRALQEQLGLKLEPTRASIQTIIVDRVQRPSEN